MPMTRLVLSLLLLAGLLIPLGSAQQGPGDTPQLTLTDGLGNQVPPPGGPFDSSGVFTGSSGLFFNSELDYLAEAQNNFDVPWGLLVSLQQTSFPTNLLPPPLFVQPPFVFLLPNPAMLDAAGEGAIPMVIPVGLYDGTLFFQAIIQDVSSFPALKLSNGVRVEIEPPEFNARVSFVRSTPALGVQDLDGVGHEDIDGDTLNGFPPFGLGVAPTTDTDSVGLPQGFKFLPIVSNSPDGPINPLARPVTSLTANITASQSETIFAVTDTSGFPPQGSLIVSFQFKHPWNGESAAGAPPKAEVVTYTAITPTSFLNVQRKQLGSSGNSAGSGFTHIVGELVVGEYSLVTTSAALSRSRVALDARNPDLVHLVVPAFSFLPAGGGTSVTMDIDLFLYEDQATGIQGFCMLDRVSHTWRVIPGTEVDTSLDEKRWNPMVAIAPDGRSMIAAVRVSTGDFDASPSFTDSYDPDELWAIRLDGEDWPVSASEAWQISYELQADPNSTATDVRSRAIHMPSVAIVGEDSENYVAFVGLAHKFAQSDQGTNVSPQGALTGPFNGSEAAWVRREVIVRDYIDLPLAAPGSSNLPPSIPRLYVTNDFGITGSGGSVAHFDPAPVVADDAKAFLVAAGPDRDDEDMFIIDNVNISSSGEPTRSIRNISGHGAGSGSSAGSMRPFYPGGHGRGRKATISPGGTRVAWVFQDTGFDNRDWLHIARTNGTSFSTVDGVFKDPSSTKFKIAGAYANDRIIAGLYFYDEDRIIFLMGINPYADPLGLVNPAKAPLYDVFSYTISTDTMVNITNTAQTPTGLDALGAIVPAGHFLSPNRQFLYVIRDGVPIQGNTILDPGVSVMNILAVNMENDTAFDISGDELNATGSIANLDLPASEALAPVESPASMGFLEGSGVQDGFMFFTAHLAGDANGTDELFGFHQDAPFLSITITSGSPAGSHISNVTPDPYGSRVAFAQTADTDPLAATQHGFVADFSSFGFVRDLTPTFVSGGSNIGRVMDGSFHFLPASSALQSPQWNASPALVFCIGDSVDSNTGVARQTAPVYYSLANLSNTLLEPIPVLLPLFNVAPLGPNYRIYLTSAGLSTGAP